MVCSQRWSHDIAAQCKRAEDIRAAKANKVATSFRRSCADGAFSLKQGEKNIETIYLLHVNFTFVHPSIHPPVHHRVTITVSTSANLVFGLWQSDCPERTQKKEQGEHANCAPSRQDKHRRFQVTPKDSFFLSGPSWLSPIFSLLLRSYYDHCGLAFITSVSYLFFFLSAFYLFDFISNFILLICSLISFILWSTLVNFVLDFKCAIQIKWLDLTHMHQK